MNIFVSIHRSPVLHCLFSHGIVIPESTCDPRSPCESPVMQVVPTLESWRTRGMEGFEFGPHCVRAGPETDRTNGFFVAVIQRKIVG